MIDYHVHTPLCNHAEGVMEAYVRKALEIGLKEICFLDHLTVAEYAYQSGRKLSMTPEEVPLYFQAVQLLKQRYKGSIDVKVGLEIDFNPEHVNLFYDIVKTYSFDVIGSSLHFPVGLDVVSSNSDWKHGKGDTDHIYSLYFEQMVSMLEHSYYDMVCHLDLVKKYGRNSFKPFDKEIDEIVSIIGNKNIIVEVNTSGYNHPAKEVYPSPDIIKKCLKAGIGVTLGSDAHHPQSVGQNFDRALSVLISAGYKHLSTFARRKRGTIPIKNAVPQQP